MSPHYTLTDVATIPAPAERVWQLLVEELGGAGRWWHTNNTFDARRPVDTVGAIARMAVHPGGVGGSGPTFPFVGRTTDVTPGRRLVQAFTGSFRGTGTFTVDAVPSADGTDSGVTRLALTFDVEPAGLVRQVARVKDVGVEHSTATRAAFERLADLVTGSAPDGTRVVVEATDRVVVTADGARLHVSDSAPGTSREAVVLVHGWGGDHGSWHEIAPTLVRAGHRVVTVDLRGHGWSTSGTAAVTVTRLGDDLQLVVDALRIPRAVLVGHSGGGLAAVHLAGEDPDRVSGLVLLGTAVKDAGAAPPEIALMGSPLLTALLRRPGLAEKLLQKTMGPGRAIPARPRIAATLADTPARVRAAYFRASAGVDLTAACTSYGALGRPAVVLRGDEDQVVDGEGVALTAELLGTSARVVPFAGHVLPLEEPEAVLDAVTEVLASTTSTSPLRRRRRTRDEGEVVSPD